MSLPSISRFLLAHSPSAAEALWRASNDDGTPPPTLRNIFASWVSTLAVSPERTLMERRVSLFRQMGNGEFESNEMLFFLNECFRVCDDPTATTLPDAALNEFLEGYLSGLIGRHRACEAPGYFLGSMMLLDLTWKGRAFFLMAPPNMRESLQQSGRFDLYGFLGLVFAELLVTGDVLAVENAASELQLRGEDAFNDGKRLRKRGYEQLYSACASFVGAFEGFRYVEQCSIGGDTTRVPIITTEGISTVTPSKRKACRDRKDQCNKRMAEILHALGSALAESSDGHALPWHCSAAETMRVLRGLTQGR